MIISNDEGYDSISNFLELTYYKGKSFDQFSSASLVINQPDLYTFFWNLKLKQQQNININEGENLKIYNQLLENTDFNSLVDLNLLHQTMILLNINDSKVNAKIVSSLNNFYDKRNKLFFINNEGDDIERKLHATKLALEIYKKGGDINEKSNEFFKEIEKVVYEIALSSFNENEYSLVNSLSGKTSQSISILMILNSEKILNNQKIDKWLNDLNEMSKKGDHIDLFYISSLNTLKDLNNFFGNKTIINQNIINDMNKNTLIYKSKEISNNQFIIDPQYMYLINNLYLLANQENPYEKDVVDFIDLQKKRGYSKNLDPRVLIPDMFYGVYLAEQTGFNFNKEKVNKAIIEQYDLLSGELSKGKPILPEDIEKLYYLVKTLNITSQKDKSGEEIEIIIHNFLSKLNNNSEFEFNVKNIYQALEISGIFGVEIKSESISNIKKIVGDINPKSLDTDNVYLIHILHELNLTKSHSKLYNDAKIRIEEFKLDGGYMEKINSNLPDILTTWKVVDIYSQNNESINFGNLKSFLDELTGLNGTPYLTKYNKFTSLEILYCYYNLKELL
ncbi:hypothetical protein [Paenibacillus sp. JSM ZJ436]|uniref:hypothetical protein n=1 Tax=Paenibacillus sp. JSM ZJ436 TaxID=3376190 RepID=UPI0037C7541F